MTNEQRHHYEDRPLSAVIAEMKDEAKTFVETRINMLKSELRTKVNTWKMALPMIAVGAVLLVTAWLLLTGAIVAAIYVAFVGNDFAAAIALAILGVAYLVGGAISIIFAYRGLRETGIMPRRTIRVLKADQVWLKNQARNQL